MRRLARALGPVLMLLAALLAPLTLVSAHLQQILTSESEFVETFAPLAVDQEFQGHLVDRTVEELDIPGLSEPVVEVISFALREALRALVQTQGFHSAWEASLRSSHGQVIEQLSAERSEVHVDIGPILTEVKEAADGAAYAQFIPEVSFVFDVDLPWYVTAVLEHGSLLPWLALGLFAAGFVIARRRPAWLVVGGVVTAGSTLALRFLLAGPQFPTPADPLGGQVVLALQDSLSHATSGDLDILACAGGATALAGIALTLLRPRQ